MRVKNLPEAVRGMLQGPTVPVEWNDGMPMENWLATGRDCAADPSCNRFGP